MSDHTVKSYDDDLASLKQMLAQMGGLGGRTACQCH